MRTEFQKLPERNTRGRLTERQGFRDRDRQTDRQTKIKRMFDIPLSRSSYPDGLNTTTKNKLFDNCDIRLFPGPKKVTLADFWRMIWQENVKLVVMLTNIVENGKVWLFFLLN